MAEPDKHLTEAEKQIRRLEALRQRKDDNGPAAVQQGQPSGRSRAGQMEQKLMALRARANQKPGTKPRVKIDGKARSAKLTFNQIGLMERVLEADKDLRGSVITRIALNRLLGIDNSPEETDLEGRLNEILRRFKGRP